jgi:GTP-binding protein HflX
MLRAKIVEFFDAQMEELELVVPYAKRSLMGEIYESARIVKEEWDDRGANLVIRAPKDAVGRLKNLLAR